MKKRLELKAELTEDIVNFGITNFLDFEEFARDKGERYFAVVIHNVEYFEAILRGNEKNKKVTVSSVDKLDEKEKIKQFIPDTKPNPAA